MREIELEKIAFVISELVILAWVQVLVINGTKNLSWP